MALYCRVEQIRSTSVRQWGATIPPSEKGLRIKWHEKNFRYKFESGAVSLPESQFDRSVGPPLQRLSAPGIQRRHENIIRGIFQCSVRGFGSAGKFSKTALPSPPPLRRPFPFRPLLRLFCITAFVISAGFFFSRAFFISHGRYVIRNPLLITAYLIWFFFGGKLRQIWKKNWVVSYYLLCEKNILISKL